VGSTAVVFNPARQVQPATQIQTTSTNSGIERAPSQGWNAFPFDFSDNGSRGVSASYGGGGY
jgi:hypothetical protein